MTCFHADDQIILQGKEPFVSPLTLFAADRCSSQRKRRRRGENPRLAWVNLLQKHLTGFRPATTSPSHFGASGLRADQCAPLTIVLRLPIRMRPAGRPATNNWKTVE
ncbi:hypothetical protein BaRGS_00024502 [Batillaria attramentaria]|uniref:Uncharacterized protein n=1 Tax=Batillaria attramentaria TaxID=370345 RepID=A0ABD0KAX3_9CAEN